MAPPGGKTTLTMTASIAWYNLGCTQSDNVA